MNARRGRVRKERSASLEDALDAFPTVILPTCNADHYLRCADRFDWMALHEPDNDVRAALARCAQACRQRAAELKGHGRAPSAPYVPSPSL
jgi:hypothetical protein